MSKKIFMYIFCVFCIGSTQVSAATKSCQKFYDDHKAIALQLKENISKYQEKLAQKSKEIQEKQSGEVKKLGDMMASLESLLSKMDTKVNPSTPSKKLKHSLSRCKREKKDISHYTVKIEKMLTKLDKELNHEGMPHEQKILKKEMKETKSLQTPKEPAPEISSEAPKESFWDRVKKLFSHKAQTTEPISAIL